MTYDFSFNDAAVPQMTQWQQLCCEWHGFADNDIFLNAELGRRGFN